MWRSKRANAVAGQRLVAEAPERGGDRVPVPRAHLLGVGLDQRAQLGQRVVGGDEQAGADELGGGEATPHVVGDVAELLPGERAVAAPRGDDARGEPPERLGLRPPAQRLGERAGHVGLAGGVQRVDLRDERDVDPVAAQQRAQERLVRGRGARLRRAGAAGAASGGAAAGAAGPSSPGLSVRSLSLTAGT